MYSQRAVFQFIMSTAQRDCKKVLPGMDLKVEAWAEKSRKHKF